MFRHLIAAGALALLAACATAPSLYGPAAGPGDPGFSQTQIENNRFRVSYRGNEADSIQRVDDLALVRSAELTLERGYDWFIVTNRYSEASAGGGGGVSLGAGFGSGGRSGFGLGLSHSPDLSRDVVSLEIVLGQGPVPDNPNAHDARAVLTNLRPASI